MARNTRVKYLLGANTEENSDVALRRASASVKFGAYDDGGCCCLRKRVGKVLPGCSSVLAPTEPRNCFRYATQRSFPFAYLSSPRSPACTLSALFPTDSFSFFTVFCPRWKAHTFPSPPSFFLSSTLCIYVFFSLSLSPVVFLSREEDIITVIRLA